MVNNADKMVAYYTITKSNPVKAKQWNDIEKQIGSAEY